MRRILLGRRLRVSSSAVVTLTRISRHDRGLGLNLYICLQYRVKMSEWPLGEDLEQPLGGEVRGVEVG